MRNCLLKFIAACLSLGFATASAQPSQTEIDQLRHLSMAANDRLPTVAEAKAFYNGEVTLDELIDTWLDGDDHETRVGRFFHDMFGAQKYLFVSDETLDLIPSEFGVTAASVTIGTTDTSLDFTDDDGSHTASLSTATYTDMNALAAAVEAALEAASVGQGYTVSFDSGSGMITISADASSTLTLQFATGTNSATTVGDRLGFQISADASGATSYTAAWPVLASFSADIPEDLKAMQVSGVYYLPNYQKSSCGNVQTVDAWWSDSTVQVCSSALSPTGFDISFMELATAERFIDWSDGSTTYSATIAPQSYGTLADLATAIQDAMNAEMAGDPYTVNWNADTRRYIFSSTDPTFSLLWSSGPNNGETVGERLSFYTPADYVGLTTYTSSWEVIPNRNCRSQMSHEDCGCGEDLQLCYPREQKGAAMVAISDEFRNRALHYYRNEGSWTSLLGGDRFVGNRWLYHHYLYQADIIVSTMNLPAPVMSAMYNVPTDEIVEVPMPDHSYLGLSANDGPQRSGVVTMPGFLRRFNNFRSRIRAITERLLCQDIDASLNVADFEEFNNVNFVNSDMIDVTDRGGNVNSTPNAKGHEVFLHGLKGDDCASCHYVLDNFGATIKNWGDGAEGIFANWMWADPSQVGHVLGANGAGPRFLMSQYIQHSGFQSCMAEKVWEDFSGVEWSELSDDDQNAFVDVAGDGPAALITDVLRSDALKDVRANKVVTTTTTVAVVYDFAEDINPILQAKCTPCHAAGGGQTEYIGNGQLFKSAPQNRITDGTMPPTGDGLTQSEIDKILIYINQ